MVLESFDVHGEDENNTKCPNITLNISFMSLKDCRGISETKQHNQILKATEG